MCILIKGLYRYMTQNLQKYLWHKYIFIAEKNTQNQRFISGDGKIMKDDNGHSYNCQYNDNKNNYYNKERSQ